MKSADRFLRDKRMGRLVLHEIEANKEITDKRNEQKNPRRRIRKIFEGKVPDSWLKILVHYSTSKNISDDLLIEHFANENPSKVVLAFKDGYLSKDVIDKISWLQKYED